jgi:hypothetical protein
MWAPVCVHRACRGTNAPNTVLAAAASVIGPRGQTASRRAVRALVEGFAEAGLNDAFDGDFDLGRVKLDDLGLFVGSARDEHARAMLAGLHARGVDSVFVRYLEGLPAEPTADAVLAAITTTLAWGPLMRKRISVLTAESLPWWMQLFGALIGASVSADQHGPDGSCGMSIDDILQRRPLGEVAFKALSRAMSTV